METLLAYSPVLLFFLIAFLVVRHFGIDKWALLGGAVIDVLFLTKNIMSGMSFGNVLVSVLCDFPMFYLVVFVLRYLITYRFRD